MRIPLCLLTFCLCLLPRFGSTEQESPDNEILPPRAKSVFTLHSKPLELPTFSVLQKAESFELQAGDLEFTVKYPPILRNTERITEVGGSVLVRGVDYQVDFYLGKITLTERDATIKSDRPYRLTVSYHTLPFAIKQVYKRDLYGLESPLVDTTRESITETDGPENPFGQSGTPPSSDGTSQLEVSGSQTFGISVGSGRGITPNQELRVNVEGKASENISVLAMLSDQDLPIQPEGTTENIQDIDQKLIRITHPNMQGTLGDFEGSLGPSEFIFFPRALEGVQVEGDFKWVDFHLIPSAIPKGQSTSLVLPGEEGRSEYRLTVDGQYVIVKAGSEIVWLNGERMRRGENNDYVIREYGDPVVEFNSKHLITSNDVIRIDFEYIPEERAYQQNLYGLSSIFTLPNERVSFGASYAVETDLNQPEQALITIGEKDLEALRQNILDPDGDGSILTAPQKHTVWGFESRLNLTEQAWIEGEIAYSNLDKNTYSTADRKEVSQAWKLAGYADWEFAAWADKLRPKLTTNLDIRAMDADFVPVGASSSNRTRSRYETQYATEGFDDAFLLGIEGPSRTSQDERTMNFDIRVLPVDWLEVDAGVGRSEESAPESNSNQRSAVSGQQGIVAGETSFLTTRSTDSQQLTVSNSQSATVRNNFNWGVNFNRSWQSGINGQRSVVRGQRISHQQSGRGLRPLSAVGTESERSERPESQKRSALTTMRKWLPNLRWNDYRSSSRVAGIDATEVQSQRKSRQEGNLSYPIGPFRIIGTLGRVEVERTVQCYTQPKTRPRNRSRQSC